MSKALKGISIRHIRIQAPYPVELSPSMVRQDMSIVMVRIYLKPEQLNPEQAMPDKAMSLRKLLMSLIAAMLLELHQDLRIPRQPMSLPSHQGISPVVVTAMPSRMPPGMDMDMPVDST